MPSPRPALRRPAPATVGVLVIGFAWVLGLLVWAGPEAAQHLSNGGLTVVALLAGCAAVGRSRRHTGAIRRFWLLLAGGVLSWSAGQATWTWYESVLGREVPFPSPADIGYLGLPPLAAAALLSLPLAAPTLAGRVRTLLDGLMVAGSMLLCSWIVVLEPVFRAGGDSMLGLTISLAYPVGDVIVITIVIYTWLRARQLQQRLPVSLPLVGVGLVAFAIADSGFSYLTVMGDYSSGSVIDVGWFTGFALMLLAALRPTGVVPPPDVDSAAGRAPGSLLPYAAVTVALLTSAFELWRTGQPDAVVSWVRSALMALLVARQVLTLRENNSLTRDLEQRVAERTAELRASQQRFAALVQHSSDVVAVVDRRGDLGYLSRSVQRMLGYDAGELLGRPVCDLADAGDAPSLRAVLERASGEPLRVDTLRMTWRHASGRECQVEVTVTNLLDDPAVQGLVLNIRDVTDRVVLERQLTHQAFTDSLTGLPNRALFKDRLLHTLGRRPVVPAEPCPLPAASRVAVLFLDLDGFKAVNDTLGHGAGDELLVQVAGRLSTVVRGSDTVCRLGGDEFAVLVDGAPDADFVTGLAQRINEAVRLPFTLTGHTVHAAASVGIACLDEHTTDAEQLLRNADLAMYQAKAAGTGGYAVYHPGMHLGLVERVRLEDDLRHAVSEDQLLLHYQPMISMRHGEITGVEALVRWQHPVRGLVGPMEFIPVAEATGMIRPIGLWVLREACRQLVRWQQETPSLARLRVSVNVSARQLEHGDLPLQVQEVLRETGLAAHLLTLEMTESVLIQNGEEALAAIQAMRALGVRIAIDDFGTGYSSLSYLHRFPVDVLKIDRSFVERLSNGGDAALVGAILRLGQSMRLETVAEGIERPQEMLMLRRQGCTTGQGYHFSPPVAADRMHELLRDQDRVGAPAAESAPV